MPAVAMAIVASLVWPIAALVYVRYSGAIDTLRRQTSPAPGNFRTVMFVAASGAGTGALCGALLPIALNVTEGGIRASVAFGPLSHTWLAPMTATVGAVAGAGIAGIIYAQWARGLPTRSMWRVGRATAAGALLGTLSGAILADVGGALVASVGASIALGFSTSLRAWRRIASERD